MLIGIPLSSLQDSAFNIKILSFFDSPVLSNYYVSTFFYIYFIHLRGNDSHNCWAFQRKPAKCKICLNFIICNLMVYFERWENYTLLTLSDFSSFPVRHSAVLTLIFTAGFGLITYLARVGTFNVTVANYIIIQTYFSCYEI